MSKSPDKMQFLIDASLLAIAEEIGCDDCFQLVSAYAEAVTTSQPIPPHLEPIRTHLERCPACREEFEILLAALQPERQVEQSEETDASSSH